MLTIRQNIHREKAKKEKKANYNLQKRQSELILRGFSSLVCIGVEKKISPPSSRATAKRRGGCSKNPPAQRRKHSALKRQRKHESKNTKPRVRRRESARRAIAKLPNISKSPSLFGCARYCKRKRRLTPGVLGKGFVQVLQISFSRAARPRVKCGKNKIFLTLRKVYYII